MIILGKVIIITNGFCMVGCYLNSAHHFSYTIIKTIKVNKTTKIDAFSFLIGYFYAIALLHHTEPVTEEFIYTSELKAMSFPIYLKNGDRLFIANNRSVSAEIGYAGYALTEIENSNFDINKDWVSENIWTGLRKYVDNDDDETIRIRYIDLINAIKGFGGIDIVETQEHITQLYRTKQIKRNT